MTDVEAAARAWIAADPCPADRAELETLLANGSTAELAERLSAPLTFGTAGLRGPLRAGPAGLNLAVVRRTAFGVGRFLIRSGRAGTVIVGYDARHRSAEFAREAAGTLTALGFSVMLAPGPLPTPLTAFAVRELDAVAGIQITASHNPPLDNGIKVYLAGGAQLVSPQDTEIEEQIESAPAAVDIAVASEFSAWPADLVDAYIERTAALSSRVGGTTDLRVVATPMHGVGGATLRQMLRRAGFPDVQLVPEQAEPDPDFPTVAFPNPEEPGATDLLLALAESASADLAIAVDPDADRCALGIPLPGGGWRMLTGNEAGVLLGDLVLSRLDRARHPDPLVATTVVSSTMLAAVAAGYGVRYDETLTGFKNLVRAGDGQGTGLVFAYEEALGLCVDPETVRDKDGLSASVLACDLVADLKAAGTSVAARLDELARRFGLHVTGAHSVRVADLSVIDKIMTRLREALPTELAGEPVTETRDLLPLTDGLLFRTASSRVVIRPSGTEPKLKCYLEVAAPVPDGADVAALRADAERRLAALTAAVAALVA